MARAFGAVLLMVGAVQLSAGWSGAAAIAMLTVAVLAPYASMLVAMRLRIPPALVVLAWLAVIALAAGWVGTRSGIGWVAAMRDGVPRLLTAPRPAPTTPELLLPGVVLAVLIGVLVGGRFGRPQGGRFAALAGAITLYVGGALLTAGRADRYGVIGSVLVLCGVAGWALTERRSSRGVNRLTVVMAGTAVSAVTAAVVTALVLPAGASFEPRAYVEPPPAPLVERNPLPRLAVLARDQKVQFRHTAGDRRLHLVALTAFDGNSWQSGARYRPLGAVGPRELPPGGARTPFAAEVAIDALEGPWLPAPGVPEVVSIDQARIDVESGSLVAPGSARTSLRYEVQGAVDTPADEDLVVASVPTPGRYLEAPRLPFLFADYARRIVQGAGTPFEQAVLIEGAVREGRTFDANAPAGSSYARLEVFLFGKPDQAGAQAGTSEQFATAFTILARSAGLPTRVVFGFKPGQRQPDGTWVVRGRDALAWPEIYFSGLGWVAFDPSPDSADSKGPSPETKRQVFERIGQNQPTPRPTPTNRPLPAPATPAPSSPPATVAAPRADTLAGAWRRVSLAAAGILVAIPILLVTARGLRRARHRRAGATGAWSEVLDLLVLLGRRPEQWHTAVRIAHDLAADYPAQHPHPVMRLAESADLATFSPAGRGMASPWPELRRLQQAVRRNTPWYRRLLWAFHPRPIFRR